MVGRTGLSLRPIVMIAVLAAGQGSAAQQPPAPAAPKVPADSQRVTAGEIQRLYDAYALVQVQDALQISDTQYGQFVPRLKALQEARRRHLVARNRILQDLRRLTNATAVAIDEAAVRERLRALREEDERSAAEVRKAYETVDELLDLRQQARFRVFEEQIERKKLDLLMRARQNAKGPRTGS